MIKSKGGRPTDREEHEVRGTLILFSSLRFLLRSTKIEQTIFVGVEGKIGLRDESYA